MRRRRRRREYKRIVVVVVVEYNRIVVAVAVVVVEYNRIVVMTVVVVVVVVEYLESVIFLHRSHPLEILFLSSFLYRRYFVHAKHFVVVGAFCCQ